MLPEKPVRFAGSIFSIARVACQTAAQNKPQIPAPILASALVFSRTASPEIHLEPTFLDALERARFSIGAVELVRNRFSTAQTAQNGVAFVAVFYEVGVGHTL